MMKSTEHPNRVHGHLNSAVVFQSSAAVGLVVADPAKLDKAPDYKGGFFTPEEAREIAALLIAAAEAAEADRARPAPDFYALIASWGMGASA